YIVANTTPKLKTNWGFTGTWNTPTRFCIGPGNAQVANPETVTDVTLRGYSTTQDATYSSSTSTAFSVVRETVRNAVVTVAGNLSLQWAQGTSNANNVSVIAGTSFVVRQCA